MRVVTRSLVLVVFAAAWAGPAGAQTADEIIEKHLGAIGGRAALAKLENRAATGSIVLNTQGADIPGAIEVYTKAPNKSRTYFKLDLSQFGGTEVIIDQRCDGKTAYASNSMQGDREITGSQLQNMLNASFPSPLLTYKEAGMTVELAGKDKVGERDTYVIQFTPKSGTPSKQYYDAENFLLVRTVAKIDAPELGGEIEQTTDVSDYRVVDGVKVPFVVSVVNPAQNIKITLSKVEHNKPLDDAMFSRPVAK